jgi:hypothetical protein
MRVTRGSTRGSRCSKHMAASSKFYGILSLAPRISALVSLYGLIYNPAAVEPQVTALSGIVPEQALDLISDKLAGIVSSITRSAASASWSARSMRRRHDASGMAALGPTADLCCMALPPLVQASLGAATIPS